MIVTWRYGRDDLVDEFLQALYAIDADVFNELCRLLQSGEREHRQSTRVERGAERRAAIALPTRAEAEVLRETVPLPFALTQISQVMSVLWCLLIIVRCRSSQVQQELLGKQQGESKVQIERKQK